VSVATTASDQELARVVRDEAGKLVASLARWCGDLAIAEEAVAEAIVKALTAWRRDGVPAQPGAWLRTVARREALDRLRRAQRYAAKLQQLEASEAAVEELDGDRAREPDDRLPLLFTCCHPALGRDAQIALTLRAVVGLTTAEIARAFLTSETTVAQRITRAKRKIVQANIPFVVPAGDALADRLDQVLTVLYLTYTEGHTATSGTAAFRRDLAEDALWLTGLLARWYPDEPEVVGLLALITLQHAREAARWTPDGRVVLLRDQDRRSWDHAAIARGIGLVERAGAMRRPGRYQLQAAIAAVHAEADDYGATDWPQIVALYDLLRRHDDSPVVRLNRAVANSHVAGPAVALAEVDALAGDLEGYHLFHAVRGELLRRLGRDAEARAADRRALELTANVAERAILLDRLDEPSASVQL
jgi:RNA polymerase sigma-70 factor (ECF subfamily)